MALLAVHDQGAELASEQDALVVRRHDAVIVRRPVHEVTEVHLYGRVSLHASAWPLLIARSVDVVLFTERGTYLGALAGRGSPAGERRRAQYRLLASGEICLGLARTLVAAKLTNQRFFLLRVRRAHPECGSSEALASLRALVDRAREAPDLDALRGLEGLGARMYFRGLARAVRSPEMTFVERTRRPPRDPFNACLSFGYTLLLARVESALLRAGLDPHLGALHEPGRGAPSLALDLMEPLRPIVVDRLVLRLVNKRQLDPAEFVTPTVDVDGVSRPGDAGPDDGAKGVHLGPIGRATFVRAFYRQWRERVEYPPRNQRLTLAALVDLQAVELAQRLTGERAEFEPLVWR